jgi:hypothetical protein
MCKTERFAGCSIITNRRKLVLKRSRIIFVCYGLPALNQPHLIVVSVDFAGVYKMDLTYGGLTVPGSPFQIVAYDINRIKVYDLQDAILNQETSFKGNRD